jgi:hypothetical protein
VWRITAHGTRSDTAGNGIHIHWAGPDQGRDARMVELWRQRVFLRDIAAAARFGGTLLQNIFDWATTDHRHVIWRSTPTRRLKNL